MIACKYNSPLYLNPHTKILISHTNTHTIAFTQDRKKKITNTKSNTHTHTHNPIEKVIPVAVIMNHSLWQFRWLAQQPR